MSTEINESESKILEAARTVFRLEGFKGARMQQIADQAGISKASLHYYFRSKENLFDKIVEETMKEYLPVLATWDDDTDNWQEKLRTFVPNFMHFLQTKPLLFILGEINRNPEKLLLKKKKAHKSKFFLYFEKLREKGKIKDIEPIVILTYLHSLCCYPILNEAFFAATSGLSEKDYKQVMSDYPQSVAELLINYLKKKNIIYEPKASSTCCYAPSNPSFCTAGNPQPGAAPKNGKRELPIIKTKRPLHRHHQ